MRNRLLQTKEELVDVAFEKALAKLKGYAVTMEYMIIFSNLSRTWLKELVKKTWLCK